MFKKYVSLQEVREKIKHYCAYQERCHAEVKQKLIGFGLREDDINEVLVVLIEENFLNEERFAKQYVRGKFIIKKWGRNKIKYELQKKQVSQHNIKIALSTIDEEDYINTLQKELQDYYSKIKSGKSYQNKIKAQQYLKQRGFELSLIIEQFKELSIQNTNQY